jgi:hypothetical protein
MKRIFLLFMIFGAWLLHPGMAGSAEKAGDVVYLKGKAVIERRAKTVNAKLKAPLEETDNVATRDRTRVKMLFRDDSILTLGSNTKLIIKQYLYNPESKRAESIYELADGKLKAVVGGSGFKVTTPTAFAAARGTVFVIWYDPATDTTGIGVIEGELEVKNIKEGVEGTLVLKPGQMSLIAGNMPPKPPKPFTPDSGGPGGGGPASFLGELFETSEPVVEMPAARIDQIRLDLVERAALIETPPVLQQPSTVTSVILNLIFPK